jgi:RecA/RadA recombinase
MSIDRLLGGGIRSGMVTDIFGQSGAGKSQLCFMLCANYAKCSRQEDAILFIDTVGTFRPERISEIAGTKKSNNVLNKIIFVRALSTADQINAIKRIPDINARLTIIDTATSLFSDEFTGVTRHIVLRKHLHKLSLTAINFDCAIVITNMIRSVPIRTTIINQDGEHDITTTKTKTITNSFQQREFMEASVSIYTHMKLKLEVISLEKSLFRASLIQPLQKRHALFTITSKGIGD